MSSSRAVLRRALPLGLAAMLARCGSEDVITPREGLPARISVAGGNSQSGTVGEPLADSLIVRVSDSRDRPVQDVQVAFELVAGGTGARVIPDTAITGSDGQATSRWVLGQIAGPQRVEARVLGQVAAGTLDIMFDASGAPQAPDTVYALSGRVQTGVVGLPLSDSLVVIVLDSFGNPLAGQRIGWTVTGGGSVSPDSTSTGSNGRSGARRTLGPNAGQQTTRAVADSLPGITVVFNHTAVAAAANNIVKLFGDGQTGIVGLRLTDSLVIRVRDANGNGVPGWPVTWVASPGSGQVAPTQNTTDAEGEAFTRWILGATAGVMTVTATTQGVEQQVTFTATANPSTATRILAQTATTLAGTAGQPVSPTPSVKVTDANNNEVQGVTVTFRVTAGGGGVSAGTSSDSVATIATDAQGIATLSSWTLGPTAGTGNNIVQASANGQSGPLSGSPVTFTASAATGVATQIALNAGNNQTATGGTAVPVPPSVITRDAGNNPVGGVSVTFAVTAGNGTVNCGAGEVASCAVTTGSSGIAAVTDWILGGGAGTNNDTLSATANGLSGSPVTFVASAASGGATFLVFRQQPGNVVTGAPISPAVTVEVRDGAGNLVTAATNPITLFLGNNPTGATLGGTVAGSAVAGLATFALLSLDRVGTGYTLLANSPGLVSATSTAFNVTAASTTTAIGAISPATTVVGQPYTVPVTVAPVSPAIGTPTGAVNVSDGSVSCSATLGGGAGSCSLTSTTAGTKTITALYAGDGNYAASAASGASHTVSPAGPATQMALNGGNNQSAPAGTAVATPPSVIVHDAFNNVVSGVSVTFAVSTGGGTVNCGAGNVPSCAVSTDATGIAAVTSWTLGTTAGTGNNTLTASSGTLSGSPVTFVATALAGPARQLGFATQPSNAAAGVAITPPVAVSILDQYGNLTNSTVKVKLQFGNNPTKGAKLSGNGDAAAVAGIATFPDLKVNKPGTGFTLQATSPGLTTATSTSFDIN